MPDSIEMMSITPNATGLAVVGEIDASTAPALGTALAAADHHPLVVDLAGVTFCDSSGLRVLLEAHQRLADEGRRLVLANPSEVIARLFDVAGVNEHLDVGHGI